MSEPFDAEILAYLSGESGAEAVEAMDARLRREPAAARRFAELCQHEVALAGVLRMAERAKRITSAPLPRVRRRRRRPAFAGPWAAAAAAVVALGLGVWWHLTSATVAPPPPAAPVAIHQVPAGRVRLPAADAVFASLDRVHGEASIERAGSRLPAAAGTALLPGDRLATATASGSGLGIVLADGSRITCGPGSTLELPRSGRRFLVPLGTLDAEVAHQAPGAPLRFSSPLAEAEVVGTRLHLVVDPSATRLEVSEGAVRLTRLADSAAVNVPAGSTATAAADRELRVEPIVPPAPTTEPLPLGAVLAWHEPFTATTAGWVGELAAVEGADGIALRSRLEQPGSRFFAEIRSPRLDATITAGETTYLRFRYRTEGFLASDLLKVMPKLADQSNFGAYLRPQRGSWASATVRLGADFEFINDRSRHLATGDAVRFLVFLGTATDDVPHPAATLWIDDVWIFTAAGPVRTEATQP